MEELEFQRLVLGDRVFVKCPDDVWRAGRIASPHVEQKAGAGPVRHVCVIEGDGRYDGHYARHAMRFGSEPGGGVMRLRQGRKNPLTLYVQLGDEPADDDPCVGFAVGPLAATSLCRMVNDTRSTTGGWVREALFEGLAQHARERA